MEGAPPPAAEVAVVHRYIVVFTPGATEMTEGFRDESVMPVPDSAVEVEAWMR